jgi:flavin reductase (DIM6/NTAB) family NADH-FMN oxidoreductase RutF
MTNAFDDIVATVDYPMIVVTAAANGENSGCLAGFHTQCSIDPPRWLVCVSQANHTHDVVRAASTVAVHVLRTSQEGVATLFGSESGDEVDKFAHCEWSRGPDDVPVLADTDWFAGRVLERADVGDHTALLLEVLPDGSAARADEPQLGFQQVREVEPGHDADE